ncbi:hypothetical protein CC2G_007839 [Coprinopsis cinerea AmutBmut pab1-1]|nr:hypothetical protein CC2G_007839 [Coprinopsis cinerea AmutBmut pab1-1]
MSSKVTENAQNPTSAHDNPASTTPLNSKVNSSRWRYVELPDTPPEKPSLARTKIRKRKGPKASMKQNTVDDPESDSSTEYIPVPRKRRRQLSSTPPTDDGHGP